jgi:alkylation response protein AidB-like acyl-CoA dehydrogenase
MAVVARRLAADLFPEPLVPCGVLAARLLAGCEEDASAELLSGIASGELIAGVAFQESAGDLGTERPAMRAEKAAGGLVLRGTKRYVVGGAGADGFVVSARRGNGTVVVWVPAGAPGVRVTHRPLADGRFAAEIALEGVEAPAEHLLARENNAPAALARAVEEATAIVCAELVGLMDRTLETTLEYLRTRVQFGRAIGSFQALQHRAVDLFVQLQLASATLGDALEALAAQPDEAATAATVSRAKARCSDAAALVTRQAIQMHGAIGFTEDSDVGLYVKRALVLGAWLGNSAHHRRRYARLTPVDLD